MVREKWILKTKPADYQHICETFKISYPLAKIIANKDIATDEDIKSYLSCSLNDIHHYSMLKDMKKAISTITKAVDIGQKIRVVGDYDVDGVTSTYLLVSCLESVGAFVSYKIPDRVTEGYGINMSIIETAIKDGVDLIVTCDNGIAAVDQIQYAMDNGLNVVVTDHHECPEILPKADCLVNPKQPGDEYPEKEICGAVVAALLCQGIYESYNMGSFIDKYIDIMAIATICDVMELRGMNRSIVKLGLNKLNTTPNTGLKALIDVNGLSDKKIASYHLGFVLGPCINATGRLETADVSVELLMSESYDKAYSRAEKLLELNTIRKEKTERNLNKAIDIIERTGLDKNKVLVVYIPACHESLAGIIAGRLREKYNKPTICFTDSGHDEEILKGSGRSVEEYNMYEKLTEVKDWLFKFGGHKLAAGLSIEKSNLSVLTKELNSRCDEIGTGEKKVFIDNAIAPSLITVDFIKELSILEPFGKGNEKPVFADQNLVIKSIGRIGKEGQFLRLTLVDSTNSRVQATVFNHSAELIEYLVLGYGKDAVDNAFRDRGELKINLIYNPEINEYNGTVSVKINVTGFNFTNEVLDRIEANLLKQESNLNEMSETKETLDDDKSANNSDKKDTNYCVIVGAADVSDKLTELADGHYVYACDGGYKKCLEYGITPNMIIADFDSSDEPVGLDGVIIEKHKVEKDATDTALAVDKAIEDGYTTIYMLGALGGRRFDHSLANVSLVAYGLTKGVRVIIVDDSTYIYGLKSGESLKYNPHSSGDISVFAFGGEAKGVTIKGLKYEVEDVILKPEISLGVSNSFVGKYASISVKEGCLVVCAAELASTDLK